jgi:glycosyltransferase involved in cell wall biosynthesis
VRLVLAAVIIRKRDAARKIKVLMVGAGKEYLESRKIAESLGLLDGILTMKPGVPKDEVPGILAALDIAVLPGSTDIICPIKIQEYMACELPSVAPDYACNREVLRDGVTGALFTPKDEADLAAKIIHLADNRELREEMGRRAREEVIRRFSWEATWGAALECVLERTHAKSTVN